MSDAFVNYGREQIDLHYKIVYFGPIHAGKYSSLWHLRSSLGNPAVEITRMAHEHENQVFWDGLTEPCSAGRRRFHVYVIPGAILREVSLVRLLMGVDGIVFVADSQPGCLDRNVGALEMMRQILR